MQRTENGTLGNTSAVADLRGAEVAAASSFQTGGGSPSMAYTVNQVCYANTQYKTRAMPSLFPRVVSNTLGSNKASFVTR